MFTPTVRLREVSVDLTGGYSKGSRGQERYVFTPDGLRDGPSCSAHVAAVLDGVRGPRALPPPGIHGHHEHVPYDYPSGGLELRIRGAPPFEVLQFGELYLHETHELGYGLGDGK